LAAGATLAPAGVRTARVVAGDGTLGLAAHGLFDAVVASAAFPSVPSPLVAQLVPGGRLVQPIGRGGHEEVVVFERRDGSPTQVTSVTLAHLVSLLGAHGHEAVGPPAP
jgi:protein-L-isoaspartate(D-aspartate) O-methyltransferase